MIDFYFFWKCIRLHKLEMRHWVLFLGWYEIRLWGEAGAKDRKSWKCKVLRISKVPKKTSNFQGWGIDGINIEKSQGIELEKIYIYNIEYYITYILNLENSKALRVDGSSSPGCAMESVWWRRDEGFTFYFVSPYPWEPFVTLPWLFVAYWNL
jgi:hypothetical protein